MDIVLPGTPQWDQYLEMLAEMERDAVLPPELAEVVARVTADVAEGLARIVPPGFRVSAPYGTIRVDGPQSRLTGCATVAVFTDNVAGHVNNGESLEDALIDASRLTLSTVQDGVTEELHIPWPRDPGGGRSAFAEGCAELTNGVLRLWFAASDGVPVTDVISVVVGSVGTAQGT